MADRTVARGGRDTDFHQPSVRPKTSAAAVFSLVFGLSALFSALIVVLAPLGVVFGLIGLVLGIVGRRNARDFSVTGSGVAAGGLVLSVLGLLIGIALTATLVTFLTDPQNMREIQRQFEDLSRLR
jgi:hypothetical protein